MGEGVESCKVSSPWSLSKPGFLPANLSYAKVLGDLHHLLARKPVNILWPFSSENLFFSKGDYSQVRCHPPNALDKVAYLYVYTQEKWKYMSTQNTVHKCSWQHYSSQSKCGNIHFILSAVRKKALLCHNLDESWKRAKWKKPVAKKPPIVWFHL